MGCGASNGVTFKNPDEKLCDLSKCEGGVTEVHVKQAGKLGCRHLILGKNGLVALPAGLGALAALTTLSCAENKLAELPEDIAALAATLTHLDASDNKLRKLPEGIGALTALRVLALYKNELATLPDAVSCLVCLEDLNVFNNKLIKLPAAASGLTAMRELCVAGNKLKTLPSLEGMPLLQRLAAFGNFLVVVPRIAALRELRRLELYRNQLDSIPDVSDLPLLEEFNVSNNRLTELPGDVVNSTRMECLEASKNLLVQIPENVGGLTRLWKVMLGFNKLTSLPAALFGLPLRTLDVQSNCLTKISSKMRECATLVTLLLSNNQIAHIPEFMVSAFPAMNRLAIDGNPVDLGVDENVVWHQKLARKFDEIPEGKFLGIEGAPE